MDASGQGRAYHAGQHYENFPVGSWLIPRQIRPAVVALYRFARTGDDLADEGSASATERCAALAQMRSGLARAPNQTDCTPLEGLGAALASVLHAHGLPLTPAHDLLDAFVQDAQFSAMASEADVLAYCQKSAAPIGQIMLGFFGLLAVRNADALVAQSDAICRGLQLANFAQDMGEDRKKGRCYFPDSWLPASEPELATRMAAWADAEIAKGIALPQEIRRTLKKENRPGAIRFPWEIATTICGGQEIVRRVRANPQAVWQQSPRIPAARIPLLISKAFFQIF